MSKHEARNSKPEKMFQYLNFKPFRIFQKRAFTLLEVIIALGILLLVSFLILRTMNTYKKTQDLNSAVELTLTVLSEAREHTLSSQDDSQYGVHFEADRVVVYKGATYVSDAVTNEVYLLPSSTFISTTTFALGGSNILFNRLLGTTANFGTTTIALRSASTTERYVVTGSSGLIEQK